MKIVFIVTMFLSSSNLLPQYLTAGYFHETKVNKNHDEMCSTNLKFGMKSTSSITDNKDEKCFTVGFLMGLHSANLTQNGISFDRSNSYDAYIKLYLSNEVHSIISFIYWKSKTKEITTFPDKIQSKIIESKGLKLGLDFQMIKLSGLSLLIGPAISIEKINIIASSVYALGVNMKLNIPIWKDIISIISMVNYQTGSEALNFGGGFNYSFWSYLGGIEINLIQ